VKGVVGRREKRCSGTNRIEPLGQVPQTARRNSDLLM
jgi:hypothetical protein